MQQEVLRVSGKGPLLVAGGSLLADTPAVPHFAKFWGNLKPDVCVATQAGQNTATLVGRTSPGAQCSDQKRPGAEPTHLRGVLQRLQAQQHHAHQLGFPSRPEKGVYRIAANTSCGNGF